MEIIYQKSTETIRQMPQNYLLANREKMRWICDADLAADLELAHACFSVAFTYAGRSGTGENFAEKATLMLSQIREMRKNKISEELDYFLRGFLSERRKQFETNEDLTTLRVEMVDAAMERYSEIIEK